MWESFFIYIDLIPLYLLGNLSVYAFVNSAIGEKKIIQAWYLGLFMLFIAPLAELECQRFIIRFTLYFHCAHLWLCLAVFNCKIFQA